MRRLFLDVAVAGLRRALAFKLSVGDFECVKEAMVAKPHSALDLCEHGAYFLEIRIRLKIDSAVSWDRGLWDKKEQRKEQRTKFDRCKRILGTLGLWLVGGTKKRRSDSGAAEMSMERSKCGSCFCLMAARCHKHVPVDEPRSGQVGSK